MFSLSFNIMQKKLFLFQMILMLCMPAMLRAQETLTVYEGASTNSYVPAIVYYFDYYSRSQFVIPADSLIDMENSTVSSVTFYTTSQNIPYTAECPVDVYLMEVDYTTMGDLELKENGEIVYSGILDFVSADNGGMVTITFSTPYHYTGGNLLVGIENTEKAGYKNIRFLGQTVSGAARSGYNSGSLANVTGTIRNFIPQTTFTYTLETSLSCRRPIQLEANPTPYSAELSWEARNDETSWQICLDNDENNLITANTNPFTIPGLLPETSHTAKVRANCGNEYSPWSTGISFTTLVACPVPTDLTVNYTGGTSAEVSWSGVSTYYNLEVDGVEIPHVTSPYILGGLEFATTYAIKVQADCENDGYSAWSDAVSFGVPPCDMGQNQCVVTIEMHDSYGDGWNGNAIQLVDIETGFIYGSYTIEDGNSSTVSIPVCKNSEVQFVWVKGSYPTECSWVVYDNNMEELFSGTATNTMNSGYVLFTHAVECGMCFRPTDLNVSYDGGSTAELTWSGTASSYNIEIDGDLIDENVTSPYTLTNLVGQTYYTVSVQANCGDGETSGWSHIMFATGGCQLINYTLNDTYGDGWNGNAIKVIGEDCEVLATVTMDNGSSITENIFLCNTYLKFVWQQGLYTNETSWSFTAPNGDVLFSGQGNAVGDGDVLYIIDNEPVARPSDLVADEVGTRSVTLSWTENGSATSWQISLDGDEDNLIDATSIPFTITGLVPETEYTVTVRSIVSEDTSRWTCNPVTFSTLEECKIPTNLQVSEIEPHSATLEWTENGEATEWVVACKVTGSNDDFTEITTTANPFTLTGLAPETRYTVKVRPVCDFGTIKWSDEVKFPSGIACHAPTGLTVTDVIPTGATISWTGDAESYDLRYMEETDYSDGWLHHVDVNGAYGGSLNSNNIPYSAAMFPAGSYSGTQLSKISLGNDEPVEGTVTVYCGGDFPMADNEVGSVEITNAGYTNGAFTEFAFDVPIVIDNSKNLWIVLHIVNGMGGVPVAGLADQNETNGFWYSTDGYTWYSNPVQALRIQAFVGDESSLNWTEVDNLTASTYGMTGLAPNTGYKVQVRSNCGEEGLSRWTASESFWTKDPCDSPYDLYVSDITSCSATLNWTGWHDDYYIDYHAFDKADMSQFTQVGDEVTTTAEMTTYTFDLSAYSGTGSIAIKHVNPINGQTVWVDDIMLTNASGSVILSNNFDESGDEWWYLPDGWISYDPNQDGYRWDMQSDGDNYWIGSYGYGGENITDNWLIITNVELGGTLSFNAWEGNPSESNSVFGVFVTNTPVADWYVPGSYDIAHTSENSFTLENLNPGTDYEVFVGGLSSECGYYNFYWIPVRFTTSSCPPVTDLAAQIVDDGVRLDWNGGDEIATWLVRYRAQEDEIWIEDETDEETYLIEASLEPGLYVAEVKTVCDQDNQSCWIPVTFNVCQDTYGVDEQTACESYLWIDGITYTEDNNTATWILENVSGCDSIVTLNLTIFKPVNTSKTVEACGEYTWEDGDGITYYTSVTRNYWHQDSHGCWQVDTLYLTINEPSYTYLTDVACQGFTYAQNGFLITPEEGANNNQHFLNLTNAAGCDSIVELYLTYQYCDLTCGNDIEDIDGNTYGTMLVNNLCWMTSNLRTTRYYDAVHIPFAVGYSFPFNPSDESSVGTYGRLYDWASASRGATTQPIQGACPEGWRLPSQAELNELASYYSIHQLRSADNWLNNVGNNESGFNMQPGGFYNGTTGACERKFGAAYFYTSDMVGSTDVIHLFCPCYCDEFIFEIGHNPENGYSIRCVRDW
jgi:uncharacterized protein (TIGR02145 family)